MLSCVLEAIADTGSLRRPGRHGSQNQRLNIPKKLLPTWCLARLLVLQVFAARGDQPADDIGPAIVLCYMTQAAVRLYRKLFRRTRELPR